MQHSLRKNALETTVRKYFQRCFGEVLAKTGRGHQVVVGNKAGFWLMHAKIIFLLSHYLAFNLTGLEKGLVFLTEVLRRGGTRKFGHILKDFEMFKSPIANIAS